MNMRTETAISAAVKPSFGAEFQPFLYGLIGDDPSGMPLSVLSVLARRDLDPWEQAGNWSRLPRQAATGELVAVIASLPPGLTSRPEPQRIAERLIALLPSPRGMRSASGVAPIAGNKLSMILFYLGFLLLGQWVVMGLRASMSPDKPAVASIEPAAPVHPDRPDLQ